jgi:peptide/nickel transport system permease protein
MSAIEQPTAIPTERPAKTGLRIIRYIVTRLAVVGLTLLVGLYVAIIVANLGGYVDDIIRDRIESSIMGRLLGGWLSEIDDEAEREAIIEQTRIQMIEASGLSDPFLLRCARWLVDNLTFQNFDQRILEAYPNSLLLFGTASLLLYASCLFLALFLSRKYGSFLDRLVVSLSPISSMPSWVHGLLLVMVFSVQLNLFPMNVTISPAARIIEQMRYGINLAHLGLIARYMFLPVLAIFLSLFFQITYTWRTFFLIYSHEDYVEVARAKGLTAREIERQYILKPTLPYIITNFALILISFWQTSMALEYLFFWPGIGNLYIHSVRMSAYNPTIVMGVVTIFAVILALTVLVLDIVYVLVDPRVRFSGQEQNVERRTLRDSFQEMLRRLKSPRFTPPETLSARLKALSPAPQRTARPRHQTSRAGWGSQVGGGLKEILRYPSAVIGLLGIAVMVGVSLYALISMPYQQMHALWVGDTWTDYPENAMPAWINYFRKDKLPVTVYLSSKEGTAAKTTEALDEVTTEMFISYTFDFTADSFPQDIIIQFDADYQEKRPYVALFWYTPDGREIKLGTVTTTSSTKVYFSQDEQIRRRAGGINPHRILFAIPDQEPLVPLKGTYELRINAITFEASADLNADVIVMGKVYGVAGTDHRRRDLAIALLWGTPVALALGFLGAICTTTISILVAAVGVWHAGWVDGLVQGLTEVNIMLPVFPVAVMAYYLYGKNVWLVIGAIILFSILGTSTKNYRAAFIQVKDSPYIEAARAYGAPSGRMIFRYMIPRILPVIVPQMVAMVPGYVFLEATLAIFGVSDPYIPTWGNVIYDALVNGAFRGYYYWILEPVALLMVTGLAFALLGFALDRVFNPRLRNL